MSSHIAALCVASLCFHGGLCGPLSMTILHLNDHHSHLENDDFKLDLSTVSGLTNASGELEVHYGGFPMLASLVQELTANTGGAMLKIHAGDAITGTTYYSVFKGEADAAMVNYLCPDVFTFGNHEFDDGDAVLAEFLDKLHANISACNTAVVSANVVPGATSPLKGKFTKYAIKSFEGEDVAVVGITTRQKTMMSSNPSHGTALTDEVEAAQSAIDELVAEGHDKIVLVTHIGLTHDLHLASQLKGVDVVIGGDSHTLMGSSSGVGLISAPVETYPKMTVDSEGKPVCVAQAWEYAHLLGMLSVEFDESGEVTSCTGAPAVPFAAPSSLEAGNNAAVRAFLEATDVFHAVEPDAAVKATLDVFEAQVDVLKQSVVGESSATLCLERIPGQGRSTLCEASETWEHGSQIGQVVAHAFLMVTPTADVGIVNAGGVRVDLAAGNVSIDDCMTVLPFSDTLVASEMTGAQLQSSIEDALANFLDDEGSTGSYPIASGLRFHVDATKARGSRVSHVQVNPKMTASWADISATDTYSVVTNSFIAGGKDGYTTFGTVSWVDSFTVNVEGLIKHVRQVGVIHKPSESDYSTQVYVDDTGCDHSAFAYGDCPTDADASFGNKALITSRFLRIALAAVLGFGILRMW